MPPAPRQDVSRRADRFLPGIVEAQDPRFREDPRRANQNPPDFDAPGAEPRGADWAPPGCYTGGEVPLLRRAYASVSVPAAVATAFAILAATGMPGAAGPGAAQSRDRPIPHDAGQSVSPSFEGWYPNDDGTFTLSFGYFNRNHEEVLDIPVGPHNRFEPGPADRGQPTHLLPRRQTGVFTVTVPADFGDRTLTWSLTAGGETFAVPGHLRWEWQIDALHEVTSGNRPPVLSFEPGSSASNVGRGPAGVRQSLAAVAGEPATVTLWARDDGVKKRPSDNPPVLGIAWSKFRGPGAVTFADPRPEVGEDGRTTTAVTFGEPGDYVLRALAWDDSGPQGPIMATGFQCCWTNAYVDVRVE